MPVFAYEALDSSRSTVCGTIAADTPRQAREVLRSRGLSVREIGRQKPDQGRWSSLALGRASGAKVAATVRELATLLAVGIPLTDALDTLARQHRGGFQASLLLVRDRIASGAGLAEAIAEQPRVFDPLTVHMIEVGENSGNLEAVLDKLANFKERSLELKDRVITALLYPSIVLCVSLLVTLFLMLVVVPMLLTSLVEAGRELPWPTRFLKGSSDFLITYGWAVLLLATAGCFAAGIFVRTLRGRRCLARGLLSLPIVGPMARKQTISRIALVMSTLIRSGVVYLKAVEIAARSTRNVLFQEALEASSREVGAGIEIGHALERTGVFPPLVIHVFSVGQQSGRLEDMLERLAIDYDRQVASSSARLAATLEPILIVTLAVFVGFILFATLLPILEAGNVL